MQTTTFTFPAADGLAIHTYKWTPDGDPIGVIQIAHGMGEHAGRYTRLAGALTAAGWAVYANDHRGHGHSVVNGAAEPDEGPGGLGDFGAAGWPGLVDDLVRLNRHIGEEVPGVPRVLLGHSMGSFAAQEYVLDHSGDIDGLVLSGSTAVDLAAAAIDTENGADLTALNAPFEPARTPFDWLSRDEAEVDLYVADPLCGFGIDGAAAASMVAGAPRPAQPQVLAGVRSHRSAHLPGGRFGRPIEHGSGPHRTGGAALPRRGDHRHHHRLPRGRPSRGLQRDQPGRDHRPPAQLAPALRLTIAGRYWPGA